MAFNKLKLLFTVLGIPFISAGILNNEVDNGALHHQHHHQALHEEVSSYTENASFYDTPTGKHKVVWAQGVEAPLMSSDESLLGTPGYFEKDVYKTEFTTYETYQAKYEPNKGYFDMNKDIESRPIEANHCYLGSSINAIRWWLEQNEPYVTEYVRRLKETSIYGQDSELVSILPFNQQTWDMILTKPQMVENHGLLSQTYYYDKLATQILNMYYTRSEGSFPDLVYDVFFNGYAYSEKEAPDENTEDNFVKYRRGGYFYPLLGKTRLTKRYNTGSYDFFNKNVIKFLNEGKMINLGYLSSRANSGHALTLWGAEYNELNQLVRVFVSDTDDYSNNVKDNKHARAIFSMDVKKDSGGTAYLSNDMNPNAKPGGYLYHMITLDLAQDLLKERLADTSAPEAPVIKSESQDRVAALNGRIEIQVEATTTKNSYLTYQWYQADTIDGAGTKIVGATSSKYLAPSNALSNKYYYCEVSANKNGKMNTISSRRINIDVQDIPLVHAQTPKVNFDYSFSASRDTYDQYSKVRPLSSVGNVTDGGTLTYQWYQTWSSNNFQGSKINGATQPTFTPSSAVPGRYFYYCVVTNTNYGPDVTGENVVTFTPKFAKRIEIVEKTLVDASAPVIDFVTPSKEVFVNDATTLEVKATSPDSGTLSYQWYEVDSLNSRVKLEGETASTLTVNKAKAGKYTYVCEVTNKNVNATNNQTKATFSNEITLTYKERIIISKDSSLKTLTIDDVTLSPEFKSDVFNYNATVHVNVTKLNLHYTHHDKAHVEVVNNDLVVGPNKITIKVIAEDGSSSTYTINVTRGSNHEFGEWQVSVAATCYQPGKKVRTCNVCGYQEEQVIPQLEHQYGEWQFEKVPTCEEDGIRYKECALCHNKITEVVPHNEHQFGEWKVTKEATCFAEGLKTRTCSLCGKEETQVLPKLEHQYGDWKIEKDVTCEEDGIRYKECALCHNKIRETISHTGHQYGEWIVSKPATCLEDGIRYKECSVCHNRITETITHEGHKYSDWQVEKEATCEEDGLKFKECSVCHERITEVIPHTGHQYGEWITSLEPTCSEKGSRYKECSVCHNKVVEEIPATGNHQYGEWQIGKAPTCEEDGFRYKQCLTCDKRITETLPKLGHNYGEWIVSKEPTCKEQGTRYKECSVCHHRIEETIPTTNDHQFGAWQYEVAPSCETGGIKYKECAICHERIREEVPPTGHKYGEWKIIKEPTTTELGKKERECEYCHKKEYDMIAKLPEDLTPQEENKDTNKIVTIVVASSSLAVVVIGIIIVIVKFKPF